MTVLVEAKHTNKWVERLRSIVTLGRGLTALYVITVVLVAEIFLPPSRPPDYPALRYLASNTFIDATLLGKPAVDWSGDNARVQRELSAMKGLYLSAEVGQGAPVNIDALSRWPKPANEEVSIMELSAEPDYRWINAGSVVQVTVGAKQHAAKVLSIVPTGDKKWLLYFPKHDLGDDAADLTKASVRFLSLPPAPTPPVKK